VKDKKAVGKFVLGLIFMVMFGGGIWFALPWVTEAKLLWDCAESEPGNTCVTRMRAMGHAWSGRGDMEKARFWYGQGADRGDPAAMFHLAWTYDQAVPDDIRTRDKRQAAREQAAARGMPPPVRPPSDKINIDTAKKWYRKSANLGFAPALNNLGELYMYGVVERPDQARGFELILAAAQTGNPVARWNVSRSYMSGMGTNLDNAEAASWRTWTRRDANTTDLEEPTFSRTKLFGGNLPRWERNNLLANSEVGPGATKRDRLEGAPAEVALHDILRKLPSGMASMIAKPVGSNPSLPTFRSVAKQLPNQSTLWTKRRNKAGSGTPSFGKATMEFPSERSHRRKRRSKVDRPLPKPR